MLVKNIEQGRLVNGSVGSVVGFETATSAIANKTDIGRVESGQAIPEAQDPKLQRLPVDHQWPLVSFINGRTILCIPHEFTVNNSSGGMEAQRIQVNGSHCFCGVTIHQVADTIDTGMGTQRT